MRFGEDLPQKICQGIFKYFSTNLITYFQYISIFSEKIIVSESIFLLLDFKIKNAKHKPDVRNHLNF